MTSVAELRLWGRTIGAVSLLDGEDIAAFEYDPSFAQSGIEVSPITMPLARRIYRFPDLSKQTFHGLPGLLADSLPDRFGNTLIDAWLARQGRTPSSFNAIERLCYIGERGMGALEFQPALGPAAKISNTVDVDQLVALASDILSRRTDFSVSLESGDREQALSDILRIGTSAGGARAKAVIAWNPQSGEIRSGQVVAGQGFEYWLIKFDGVSGNRDKELEDPRGYGVIEYAYSQMAVAAGITMMNCRLLKEHTRQHFMSRRFDRLDDGSKLHMQSLCALAHFDYNMAGAYSYEQALLVMRQLELPMADIEQQFRRMVFNIVARNQDDHVKNIAFLMNKQGQWSLSPAFDVTYSFNPDGAWTAKHQMSVNGKRDGFTVEDIKTCGKTAGLKRGRAEAILSEVVGVVSDWNRFAEDAGVDRNQRKQIGKVLRLKFA